MQLLYDEPMFGGGRARVWWDENERTYHNEHVADVEANIEHAKRAANGDLAAKTGDQFRMAAHIPAVIIMQWLSEGIDIFSSDPEQKAKVRRRLNDPDWRYLRTGGGVL
jgi:hypothetical protein